MFKTFIFKRAGQEIIEYFFERIYDHLASDDPKKVKAYIERVKELDAKGCMQVHNTYLNRYTFYATISKPDSEGYTVALNSIGHATCTCPSYLHRHHKKGGYCKHIIALALMLEKPQSAKNIAVQIMDS